MSNETENQDSGWTVDTLRQFLLSYIEAERDLRILSEARINDHFAFLEASIQSTIQHQKEALFAALASAEKAVAKSELDIKEWRMNANEWRGTLSDRDLRLMPRAEGQQQIKSLDDKIDALEKRMERSDGKSVGMNSSWVILIGAVGLIATILTIAIAIYSRLP